MAVRRAAGAQGNKSAPERVIIDGKSQDMEAANIAWLAAGVALLAAAVALMLRPYLPSAIAAYGGLWLMKLSGAALPSPRLMAGWGVAVALVVAIDLLQPRSLSRCTNGMAYIGGGALAGMALGMTAFSYLWMAVGAAAGALAGGYAYSRTPAGRPLQFPSQRFFRYICAKGLPAVVTATVIGIALLLWLIGQHPMAAIQRL